MSGEAQASQVEAQASKVEQEYHREEKHQHKTLDTILLAPKFNTNLLTKVYGDNH